MLLLISWKIEELRNELFNQELLNHETREFSITRDEFYRELNEKFLLLSRAKVFTQFDIHIDIDKMEKDCLESFESKIRVISTNCEKLANKISQDYILTRGEYDHINLYYLFDKKLKLSI